MNKYKLMFCLLFSTVCFYGCHKSEDAIDGFVNEKSTMSKIIFEEQFNGVDSTENEENEKYVLNDKSVKSIKNLLSLNDVLSTKKIKWKKWDNQVINSNVLFTTSEIEAFANDAEVFRYQEIPILQGNMDVGSEWKWTKEDAEKILIQLENIGYHDLTQHFLRIMNVDEIKETRTSDAKVIRLVRGDVHVEYVCWNPGYVNVFISMIGRTVVSPEKFKYFMDENIVDGFRPEAYNFGGKLERIVLKGSENEIGTSHNKRIELYFKQGKIVQIEIYFTKHDINFNKDTDTISLFSPSEEATVENLLGQMVNDKSQIVNFINNLSIDKEQQGKIGDRTWKCISYNGKSNDKKFVIY